MNIHNGLCKCVCGGMAKPYQDYTGGWQVQCGTCGLTTMSYRGQEIAAKAWNGSMGKINTTHLLTIIGKTNSKLEEKLYTRKEVKEILLGVVKELEAES